MALNLKGIFLPALIYTLMRSRSQPIKETEPADYEYDYIVVGSGAGGAIMANRLSEDPSVKVLLLEAGSKDNVTSEVPLLALTLQQGGYDWKFRTTPQPRMCWGMPDKQCPIPAGKVIGGSTTLGLMNSFRGNKLDYDELASQGNPGWSYEEVLPFFKKSEDYRVNGDCVKDKYHSCGGEQTISSPLYKPENIDYFLKGAKELGYEETDFDGAEQLGASVSHLTMRDGIHVSSAIAFLKPISKERTNLHISLNSLVTKILIDPESKVAHGVEFEKDGAVRQVKAKKEVILSAGTYSSPKILMLSGIGPKEELDKFNIPVISDLPGVGQNLRELLSALVLFHTGKDLTPEVLSIVSTTTIRSWAQGTGSIMTSPAGIDAIVLTRTKFADKDKNVPDMMIALQSLPMYEIMEPFLHTATGFTDEFWAKYLKAFVDKELVNLQPILLNPKSQGTVKLQSSDPHDPPVVDPNYYDHEDDMKTLIEGIHMAMAWGNTSIYREVGYTIPKENHEIEACKDKEWLSDEYWECYLKYATLIKWCGCCTNKMGPDSDPMAVVDHELRVRGVTGLRVVDASVLPNFLSGLPQTPTSMMAEKVAAMIIGGA